MNHLDENTQFTVLENKTIGRNISLYRKIREMKALEVADLLGMKEATYTRYERGEASITIDFIQQVSQVLKIDPIMLLSVPPGSIVDSGNNSPNAIVALNASNCQTTNPEQNQMMLKLIESTMELNRRMMELLEKKDK
ncbi:helix-turn-helix domain-containing protein [Niastella sp. OAS944]|uniref:helix-turn-helix domain-containing protein n=1 Tax=Niastella sp. OAS944 TaxID=2664089 RepID=UPI003488780E|nr:transcriptional regulator with XRE-family HTH domain [Chitinophagaceae bacterium OAS944]